AGARSVPGAGDGADGQRVEAACHRLGAGHQPGGGAARSRVGQAPASSGGQRPLRGAGGAPGGLPPAATAPAPPLSIRAADVASVLTEDPVVPSSSRVSAPCLLPDPRRGLPDGPGPYGREAPDRRAAAAARLRSGRERTKATEASEASAPTSSDDRGKSESS